DLLNQLKTEAEKAAANPKDSSQQQKLKQILDKLDATLSQAGEKANADIIGDANSLLNDLAKFLQAHRKGDPKGVAESAKEFVQAASKLIERSKAQAAKVDEPSRKKQLL